jgi:hypothetical protein
MNTNTHFIVVTFDVLRYNLDVCFHFEFYRTNFPVISFQKYGFLVRIECEKFSIPLMIFIHVISSII